MLKRLKYSTIFICGVAFATPQINEIEKNTFTSDRSKKALTHEVNGLSYEEQDIFIFGRSFFRIPWVEAPSATTARDGLGPLFNANTCINCHPNNGVSAVYNEKGKISRGYVSKLSNKNNYDKTYGEQISINGIFGVHYEAKQKVVYEEIKQMYPDGTFITLLKPKNEVPYQLVDFKYGNLEKDTFVSNRIAPALIGLGLIEQIREENILKNEDIDDKNGDGISGKANFVYSRVSNKIELGRFNVKAGIATLIEQSAHAALNDMGLTNPLYPDENCSKYQEECNNAPKSDAIRGGTPFDLPQERLEAIVYYLSNLKIPKQKILETEGEKLFNTIGCTKCHIPSYTLDSGITIKPFSDFLLHDMGIKLSDNRIEGKAEKNEFKTKTLWGIGLYSKTLGAEANYLHDGRAKSIEEAIIWHGGESNRAKDNFKNLAIEQREDLIFYIKEL